MNDLKINVIPLSAVPVNRWSGGETRELYIYPEASTYKARDFLFRISVAKAEDEYSEYTDLPGITRHLVSLEGTAKLTHKSADGARRFMLKELGDTDIFSGDDHTTALGKITDFNVMLRGNTRAITGVSGGNFIMTPMDSQFIALFAWGGDANISAYLNDETTTTPLPDKHLMIIDNSVARCNYMYSESVSNCSIITVTIRL